MSERPKILYKYLPYNEKSESVLRDFTIKFTKPTDFNDPFDCKAADISEWTRKDWKTFFKIRLPKHYPLCSDVEIENCASVLARRTIDVKTSGEDFCDFVDDFGVSCFSELNNDILMWSHYADHHKGFCIGFYSRTTNPYFNQVRRVKYNKKYPELSSSASSKKTAETIMLTKSNHWRYEKEWRLVRDVKDGLIYSYPEELLACVIFGAKMDEPRQKLLNIFDEKLRRPEIFEVKLCERRFALRIKPISKAL